MTSIRLAFCVFLLVRFWPTVANGQIQTGYGDSSWDEMIKTGKGELTVFWFENKPILYKDPTEGLTGVEYEIIGGFAKYVLDSFKVNLKINWIEKPQFTDVYAQISNRSSGAFLGAARISILDERKNEVNFTPPYMSDISILISSSDLPLAKTREELITNLMPATAVTMKGTSFEKDIKKLEKSIGASFPVVYSTGGTGILSNINKGKKSFGYVSLLTYLFNFNKMTSTVKRQNHFINVRTGFALIYPKQSSLSTPLNAYFKSLDYQTNQNKIIGNYIDVNLFKFMENLAQHTDQEVGLLNKEKELQAKEIALRNAVIFQSGKERQIIFSVIVFILILMLMALYLFRRQMANHKLLKETTTEIDAQADEIKSINENLSALVQQRTDDLENQNKILEESAFFTAHKLRSPVASIEGLILLSEKIEWNEATKQHLDEIREQAVEIDKILHSAMTIIERAE